MKVIYYRKEYIDTFSWFFWYYQQWATFIQVQKWILPKQSSDSNSESNSVQNLPVLSASLLWRVPSAGFSSGCGFPIWFMSPYHLMCTRAQSLQLCPILCDPMDCSLPGPSVHGILQARILEWASMPSSKGSSWIRNEKLICYVSYIGRQITYRLLVPPGKPFPTPRAIRNTTHFRECPRALRAKADYPLH